MHPRADDDGEIPPLPVFEPSTGYPEGFPPQAQPPPAPPGPGWSSQPQAAETARQSQPPPADFYFTAPPGPPPKKPGPPAQAPGSKGSRQRRSRGTRRRPPRRAPLVVAAGVLVVSLVAFGVWRVVLAVTCGGEIGLSVAADPAVAPTVTVMAHRFNDAHHKVGRRCVKISANAVPSSGIAFALGGDKTRQVAADAYIPDSSLWLAVAGHETERTGAVLPRPAGSVADSPLVFAIPKSAAATGRVSWKDLEPGRTGVSRYSLHIVDPTRDATGMAALLTARKTAGSGKDALKNFTGILQNVQAGGAHAVAGDAESAFATFGDGASPVPLLVTSEQSVWRHARAGGTPVAATLPEDATMSLDFPFITVGSGAKAAAAREFLSALRSRAGAAELHRIGLRTADGVADRSITGTTGLTGLPPVAPHADPAAVIEALEAWRQLRLGTRLLTLIDVSGSMLDEVAGTDETRMQVTAQEVGKGMALLPDDAEIGLWSFSTDLDGSRPYKELVPLGPMNQPDSEGTHRAALQAALGRMRAKPLGDTGLYDSVLAAFRKVKESYQDDKINIVLVLTDGRNDYKNGINRQTLLADLKKEYDPRRPVQVVAIGFGPGIDFGDLQTIARATGGAAYQIRRNDQIRQLFQRSAALKVCDNPERCPTG